MYAGCYIVGVVHSRMVCILLGCMDRVSVEESRALSPQLSIGYSYKDLSLEVSVLVID